MKRNQTDLSLVVGIDKPKGMSSHDVINRVRMIFGESRVGHAGTLDPLAQGVLVVLVGPAARLSDDLIGHTKNYNAKIVFGFSTSTDDAEGEILDRANVPDEVYDPFFAQTLLTQLVGKHDHIPPIYSAIKIGGQKSYEAARQGRELGLKPRPIEIFDAKLLALNGTDVLSQASWEVEFKVSSGTYIRSLARDIGKAVSSEAHLGGLIRTKVGDLGLEECVSLDELAEFKDRCAIDPIKLLGYRFAFASEEDAGKIKNGNRLSAGKVELFRSNVPFSCVSCCHPSIEPSCEPLKDCERICMIADNTLKAIYEYDKKANTLTPNKVFSRGVMRDSSY